ncbi:hypothetical protein EDD36DRAFT_473779, partial [Exophiala viscosa]
MSSRHWCRQRPLPRSDRLHFCNAHRNASLRLKRVFRPATERQAAPHTASSFVVRTLASLKCHDNFVCGCHTAVHVCALKQDDWTALGTDP